MGKPFAKELGLISETLSWAGQLDLQDLTRWTHLHADKPLLAVGSGGSLSACHFAALLFQQFGHVAKALTPLELFNSRTVLPSCNVLIISASGKNKDILFAYESCLSMEAATITNISMRKESPLSKMVKELGNGTSFNYELPAGKDGFLATNSLIAFFSILGRGLSPSGFSSDLSFLDELFFNHLDSYLEKVGKDYTFTILFAGWGQPVACDLESKMAEAALANVLVSDFRNFGHGRHHWFDKRGMNSAIIALVSPEEEKLANKTLSLLPSDIPILQLTTDKIGASGTLELLIKSFYFILKLGGIQNIDPGRPGVPDYGSKLYHLNYRKAYLPLTESLSDLAIRRKARISSINQLKDNELKTWRASCSGFLQSLEAKSFGSIIFDYDGTLCASHNRFIGVDTILQKKLVQLLEYGVIIGVATGRGKSVREDLLTFIPKKFMNRVLIGYYNGSDIGLLSDNSKPDKSIPPSLHLRKAYSILSTHPLTKDANLELKPYQISIVPSANTDWNSVKDVVVQLIFGLSLPYIQVLESTHSVDIIDQRKANKLNLISICSKLAQTRNLSSDCLCIGDKGRWPGNDFQLLSHEFSLSVDEVSPLPNSCWNFSPLGIKNIDATNLYLSKITPSPKGLNLKII